MATIDLTRINTNVAAMNNLNTLREVNKNLAMHQVRLASGKRINEAADDPAGLTLATKFQVRAASQQQAIDNIGDAKTLLAVAEGGLKKVNEILGKMRIKAEQSASDTLGQTERDAIAGDLAQYAQEIDDIVKNTSWNGTKLLDGKMTGSGSLSFQTSADADEDKVTHWQLTQAHDVASLGNLASFSTNAGAALVAATTGVTVGTVGVNSTAGLSELGTGTYTVRVTIGSNDSVAEVFDVTGKALTIDDDGSSATATTASLLSFTYAAATIGLDFGNGLNVTLNEALGGESTVEFQVNYTQSGYSVTLDSASEGRDYMRSVDSAIAKVSDSMANIGALMDRLSFKEDALAIGKVNTEAAFNRLMNADMAAEQLEAVKWQILQQTATTMLAQSNTAPQQVLQLFR